MKITNISGTEIFDSRGLPTIECTLTLENDAKIVASVPAGASRGAHEAFELRDGGQRLMGLGVQKAIENLEQTIAAELIGYEPNLVQMDVTMIELDGTPDKSKLGANAILAASMAICKAQAYCEGMELYELIAYLSGFETVTLPNPMVNIINGGLHANNKLQIQEFMIVTLGLKSFRESFEVSVTIFAKLKELLKKNGKSIALGDEGGFAPQLQNEFEALDYIMEAINATQLSNDISVVIALDIAASQFYNPKTKKYAWQGADIDSDELIVWYEKLIRDKNYPIYAIEDGLSEHDWEGWEKLSNTLGSKVQLIGDDIFATNPNRIWEGIERGIANTVLIKPNQIGTVTETLQAIKLCDEYSINTVISHRSGETNNSFIADLAVGVSAKHIKAGGCSRGERMAKYNRLLRIEDDLLQVGLI